MLLRGVRAGLRSALTTISNDNAMTRNIVFSFSSLADCPWGFQIFLSCISLLHCCYNINMVRKKKKKFSTCSTLFCCSITNFLIKGNSLQEVCGKEVISRTFDSNVDCK